MAVDAGLVSVTEAEVTANPDRSRSDQSRSDQSRDR
jgi:hypothetical protein